MSKFTIRPYDINFNTLDNMVRWQGDFNYLKFDSIVLDCPYLLPEMVVREFEFYKVLGKTSYVVATGGLNFVSWAEKVLSLLSLIEMLDPLASVSFKVTKGDLRKSIPSKYLTDDDIKWLTGHMTSCFNQYLGKKISSVNDFNMLYNTPNWEYIEGTYVVKEGK